MAVTKSLIPGIDLDKKLAVRQFTDALSLEMYFMNEVDFAMKN